MSDQLIRTTFFDRIGNFFRRPNGDASMESAPNELSVQPNFGSSQEPSDLTVRADVAEQAESRTTFLRPWTKRDQSIEQLQNGMTALTDLLGSIRGKLERDSERHDELLAYLARLPQAIESLPENSRLQGEALKAIQQGIEQQNTQQGKLAEVLERMHQTDGEHREAIFNVRDRADAIAQEEQAIGESIRRQNSRFTLMLTVAIVMSMAALTAVVVFGYLGYQTLGHIAK